MSIKVGLIGFGYWGQILFRNLNQLDAYQVLWVCDRNEDKRAKASEILPNVQTTHQYQDIINSNIDLVVISTQAESHFSLVKQALEKDKNVFVEKPFTLNHTEAQELISLNKEKGKIIMVDHTYLFTPAYLKFKSSINEGIVGEVQHFHSTRADYGLFQTDVNIIWHLFYHDAYILFDLFPNAKFDKIKAGGQAHIVPDKIDTLSVHLSNSSTDFQFVCNMLFPLKERKIIATGSQGSFLFNDLEKENKLSFFGHQATYNHGAPRVQHKKCQEITNIGFNDGESLRNEFIYLSECINDNKQPHNNEIIAAKICQFLEEIEKELA